MKLTKPQSVPVVRVTCCECSTRHLIANVWADLDGEPFQAYYCEACLASHLRRCVSTRYEADDAFRSLGATHYHVSRYPARRRRYDGQQMEDAGVFAIHYFKDGDEIGLCIPDLMPQGGVQLFDKPRVWGIPHDLHELR